LFLLKAKLSFLDIIWLHLTLFGTIIARNMENARGQTNRLIL